MSGTHSRNAPSKAAQWLRCFGSLNLEAQLPDDPPSQFAAEGTAAHQVRADCLTLGMEPFDFVGQKITADGFTTEVTAEMAAYLQPGIDRFRDLDGMEFIEYRVDLSDWIPNCKGTLDGGRIGVKTVYIDDLKYGAGIPVSPIRNEQMMLYALGFYKAEGQHTFAENFELHIDQPRIAGGGGSWNVTLKELEAFGEFVKYIAELTLDPNAPRIPGLKQCQWCKGASQNKCREYAEFNLRTVSQKFDDLDNNIDLGIKPTLPSAMTPEQRSYIVQHADMFTKWLERLQTDCLNDALAGRPTPGIKAVDGRKGKREWNDEEKATPIIYTILGDRAFTKKVISPSQVEKELGKKAFKANTELQALVSQGDPKPCLVPDSDPRPAIEPIVEKFEDLGDE